MFQEANMEIRKQIDELNLALKECLNPNQFTLNSRVLAIHAEIANLQAQCKHEFDEDGICKICDALRRDYNA